MIYQDELIIEINMETVDTFKVRVAQKWCSCYMVWSFVGTALFHIFYYKVNLSNIFEV